MKKKITAAFVLCVVTLSLVAQQIPLSGSTYIMRLLNNPALTGNNGSTDVYAYYRNQWTALPGHPITMGGLGQVSLWHDQSNIGFHVSSDEFGLINNVSAQLYYAQKIKLAKDHHLSLGISFGILNTHINYDKASANDINDPNLLGANSSGTGFDMNVGIAYQWKKLTIGVSVPHIVQTNVLLTDKTKRTSFDAIRHYMAHVSYEISFKQEKWNIEPSILFKEGQILRLYQFDANVMANYKRFVFLGVGYRQEYGMSFTAAVKIARCVTVGYTYEYPIMSNVTYGNTDGSHEVFVGINFDKWIKNSDKLKHRMDTLDMRVDNVEKADTALEKKVDSLKQANADLVKAADEAKKANAELAKAAEEAKQINKVQDDVINALQTKLDSLEDKMRDYKKRTANKPVGDFSAMTDKQKVEINEGDVIKLDRVYFETNSSWIKPESFPQLDKVVEVLKSHPTMQIKILGHTDYTASDIYNQWLSDRRAKHVADYLESKGISTERLGWIGYGKRLPVADNNTDEGRALNRRVEIDIVKK